MTTAALRVHLVINSMSAGGSERSLAELLRPLAARGVDSTVVCLKEDGSGAHGQVLEDPDVRVLKSGNLAGWVPELCRLFRRERPDVVHTTLFEADVAGRLAGAAARRPVVTSLVNTSYEPVRLLDPKVRRSRLAATRMVDGWTARWLTKQLHAVSQAAKDSAVTRLRVPANRITVIERGRDPDKLGAPSEDRRRQVRRRLGISDDAELLLTAGRHEFQKGHRYLVEATARLCRERPHLEVLVAGREGNYTAELRRAVSEAQLGDRISILGHRDDVPDLLAAADVFVFPSLYEGTAGAVIEAMALGVPTVGFDIPPMVEVTDHGRAGMLVPLADAAGLAHAVAALLDDPNRRRELGAAGRTLFLQRYTIERSAARMAEFYRSVAEDGRWRRQ